MAVSQESVAIIDALERHIEELHYEYKTLLELFVVSEEQSNFLHEAAGVFFDTVYRMLIRDILLGVARLTDPLKSVGKDNLVLERLAGLAEVTADEDLSRNVLGKLEEIQTAAKPFRDYRNKYLAHLDLQASLKTPDEVLPVKRQDVDAILALFSELFNLIDKPLRGRYVSFKDVVIHDGPQRLLRKLEDAQAFQHLPITERAKLRAMGAPGKAPDKSV